MLAFQVLLSVGTTQVASALKNLASSPAAEAGTAPFAPLVFAVAAPIVFIAIVAVPLDAAPVIGNVVSISVISP